MFKATTAVHKIAKLKKRLKIIQGGSSAGKTIAILLLLIDIAQTRENLLISVVSETMPHLKRGAMRDFLNIMQNHRYYKEDNWNRTDNIYTFDTNSKIEFFSADSPDKVRGPRRDILFLNECNNIPYEAYTQLAIRSNKDIYLDYNPVAEFWVHTEVIPTKDHDFIILTYKDNEGLPQTIIDELESRKHNKNFWRVYGQGLLGEIEGKIYDGWQTIDEIPHEARLITRGLDFGYTNDPTAIVDIYQYNGGFIFDEQMYQKGVHNDEIANFLKALDGDDKVLVIADSAEPKSIDEIRKFGIKIIGAIKGPGSVTRGIDFVQSQKISMTKRSVNLIKSYRNYLWKVDKLGKNLNVPDHNWSDLMDAVRYGLSTFIPKKGSEDYAKAARAYAGATGHKSLMTDLGVKKEDMFEYEKQLRESMLK